MLSGLIGKKTYQGQGFLEDGRRVPLTHVVVRGNLVSQLKMQDKEGYNSVQLAFDSKRKITKATEGHVKKAGLETKPRFFKEIRLGDAPTLELGSEVVVGEVFQPGDIVDVTGISKGKGYAGVVKRHNFKGGPRTHGQSDRERAPGSIGQTTTPGRVYKGKRMAGRMGVERVTVRNLEVIDIRDDGVLLIKGLVPGFVNSIVVVTKRGENKKFVPLYKEITEEEKAETQEQVEEVEAKDDEAPKEEKAADTEVKEEALEVKAEEKEETKEKTEEAPKEEKVEAKEEEAK